MDIMQSKISLVPVCGIQLVVAANQNRSTIAAVVDADGRRYALAVSHVFDDVVIGCSKEEEIDDCACSDAEESEAWTFEYEKTGFKLG
jgi:hypothetical protein